MKPDCAYLEMGVNESEKQESLGKTGIAGAPFANMD